MKRLKFLPSVLMLVLCVGVLCMGIYAASPNSNQITGSITVNAANPSITIRAWTENADGEATSSVQELTTRNGGETLSFTSGLQLDFSSASVVSDVKPTKIVLEITNNSETKEMGAYISTKVMNSEVTLKDDIFVSAPLTNNNKITATSTYFYKHIGTATSTATTDTVVMELEFKANDFIESADSVTFEGYYLNIEEYNPNVTTALPTADNADDEIIKLSSKVNGSARTSIAPATPKVGSSPAAYSSGFNNGQFSKWAYDYESNPSRPPELADGYFSGLTHAYWLVIPQGVENFTTITGGTSGPEGSTLCTVGAFHGATMEKVSIPSTITTISEYAFHKLNSTGEIVIPSSVETIGNYAFSEAVVGSIKLQEGITSVGQYAFKKANVGDRLVVPSTLVNIGAYAFSDILTTEIIIQEGTQTIGANAFEWSNDAYSSVGYYSPIEYIEIPGSVTTITANAFACVLADIKVLAGSGTLASYDVSGATDGMGVPIKFFTEKTFENPFTDVSTAVSAITDRNVDTVYYAAGMTAMTGEYYWTDYWHRF